VTAGRLLWQRQLADNIVSLLKADPSVQAIWLVGSLGSPAGAVDGWSDADLAIVVHDGALADWSGATDWLRPVGRVWADSVSEQPLRKVTRVVFHDGRRLDLVFFGHTLGQPDLAGREIWSRGTSSQLASHSHLRPGQVLTVRDRVDELVNDFRFVASLAVVKLARADDLIGSHLALECARLCLVLGMLMRDAGLPAATWSNLPSEVGQVKMPRDARSALVGIEKWAAIFDAHLHAGHYSLTLDPSPLEGMIAQLRAEMKPQENGGGS
jgi:hypothetical protein